MSHDYATTNKQRKHPKVYFQKYLPNFGEPRHDIASHTPAELDVELLQNSYSGKRRFRHIAQKIRDHTA